VEPGWVQALQALPRMAAADLFSLAGLWNAHPEEAQHATAAKLVDAQVSSVQIS